MKLRLVSFLSCLFLFASPFLHPAEFINGSIRLVLHEDIGRFSLYRVNDGSRIHYEPLFSDQDPRSSFLSVSINGKVYKLGETLSFKISLRPDPEKPALIFANETFLIVQEFVFIRTPGSQVNNGVSVNISIANLGGQSAVTGFRFLLDTNLGERGSLPHFITEIRPVVSETVIEKSASETRWISKSGDLSLTGSIDALSGEGPDSVMFANWKRLSDALFKTQYTAGRNFSMPPSSVNDSAVCYYFDPRPLGKGETRISSFMLASGDDSGFYYPIEARVASGDGNPSETDLLQIQQLIARIDNYIATGRVSDTELAAMEEALSRLLEKYKAGSVQTAY